MVHQIFDKVIIMVSRQPYRAADFQYL